MRYVAGFICVWGSLLSLAHSVRGENGASRLDGTWIIESVEYDGSQLFDSDRLTGQTEWLIVVSGEKLSVKAKGKTLAMLSTKCDSSTSPKKITIYHNDNIILQGIYALDDDYLFVSLSKDPSLPRPSTFNSVERRNDIAVYGLRRRRNK